MKRETYESLPYDKQREVLTQFLVDYWSGWGLGDLEDEAEGFGFFDEDEV